MPRMALILYHTADTVKERGWQSTAHRSQGSRNREIGNFEIERFLNPIRNLKMNNPKGAHPSDRPTLNFGLEIQESFDFEISDFPIPRKTEWGWD
jgi:hypothetical protein